MQETKLSYLLSKLTPEQRQELTAQMGISSSTFYNRKLTPGTFTLDEGEILARYLEQIHGRALDLFQLKNELVEVLAVTPNA